MHFITFKKQVNTVKKHLFTSVFILLGFFGMAQNTLEQKSFAFLRDYLDHHKSTDSLYFDYVKAYENKALQTDDLEKLFYAKSEYIIHGTTFNERLKYAQQLLQLAQQQNDTRYTGLAYNKLALVYYMERDMEQSLNYELQAEELLSQTTDLYSLNKSRYGIGSMYYFLGDYEKALTFFNKTAAYYKSQNTYNDLRGYLSSIGYIGKCMFGLQNFAKVDSVLQIGAAQAGYLKSHHQEQNNAYFDLLKGQNLWAQKQYQASLTVLENAVPAIIANDDFANEHLAYLYIGKNLWALNQQEKALEYFKKIDTLFTTKQYSDLNLLEAYEYLIAFYKTNNNLHQQLFYTEQLLAATNALQANNKGLSHALHTKYETHKLKANSRALQKQLKWQQQKGYVIYGFVLLMVMAFVAYIVYSRKKHKTLRKQYDAYVAKHLAVLEAEKTTTVELETHEVLVAKQKDREKKTLSDAKVEELLQKLNAFEENKGFLNTDMKLDVLAKTLNTNAKYLSEVINATKQQNFTTYINTLRIDCAIAQLHASEKFRKHKMTALAEAFGFTNARAFSDAFVKITGLKPSYYITQIEKDERKKR